MQTANGTKWEHNYNAEKSTSDVNTFLFYVGSDVPSCSLHFHLLSIHCSIYILFNFRLHVSHSLSFLIQSLSSTSALPGTWISNCTFYRRVCGRAWMSYDLLWFTVKSLQKFCFRVQKASTTYCGFSIISPGKIAWLPVEVKQSSNEMTMRLCRSSSAGPGSIGWKNRASDFFRSCGMLQINNWGEHCRQSFFHCWV